MPSPPREARPGSWQPISPTRTSFDDIVEEVGAIDILVNNAGLAWFGPTPTLDLATYDQLFNINLRSAYFLVAALAPKMADNNGGSIVNVGSMAGTIGVAGGAAYSATKAALAAFTRSWAAEYTPAGIRVNTIAPGPVYAGARRERTDASGATTLMRRAAQSLRSHPSLHSRVSERQLRNRRSIRRRWRPHRDLRRERRRVWHDLRRRRLALAADSRLVRYTTTGVRIASVTQEALWRPPS